MFEITGAIITRLIVGPYDGWVVWRRLRGDVGLPVTRDRLAIVFRHRATAQAVVDSDRSRIGWFWGPDAETEPLPGIGDADIDVAIAMARDPGRILTTHDLEAVVRAMTLPDAFAYGLNLPDIRRPSPVPFSEVYRSLGSAIRSGSSIDLDHARTLFTPAVAEHLSLGRVMLFDMLTAEHSRRPA